MKKCLFIYNPKSGRGLVAKNESKIVARLREKYDVEVAVSQYMGHIGKIILDRAENYDLLVVSGGDGTMNEVVNSLMRLDKKPVLGYIPSGTVNDVAHSLYISRNIKKAVKNILKGDIFKHDVFKMNDKYGIYVCCAGMFTEVSYATNQNVKKTLGKMAYALHGMKHMFSTPAVKLKMTFDDNVVSGKYAFMLFLNSRSVGGMIINRHTILNDGKMDAVLVQSKNDIVNLGAINRIGFMFLNGINKRKYKGIEHYEFEKCHVETSDDTIINLDGEKVGTGSFDFEMIKEAISIIVPKKNKLIKHK